MTQAVIVCVPWSAEDMDSLPGNTAAECVRCDCRVVISEQARKSHPDGLVMCVRCATEEHGLTVPRFLPGAERYLREAGATPEEIAMLRSAPLAEMNLLDIPAG